MKTSHTFGGDWTEQKLERLQKYLKAYTTIFTKNERAQSLTRFTWMHLPVLATAPARCN